MYVKVRVIAGAKKELIQEISAGHFKISLKDPAEPNLPTRPIVELVTAPYPPSTKQVPIISGHTSPSKILSIPD